MCRELTQDIPTKSWWNCCAKAPVMVTQIKVVRATGLEKQDTREYPDPASLPPPPSPIPFLCSEADAFR